jgi:anti-anti-sigma regulatory factor
MGAAISIDAADNNGSAASLHGRFDQSNRWFLDKHLRELPGDIVLDCHHVEDFDNSALSSLRKFCEEAAAQNRRVVIRALPRRLWRKLTSA